MYKVVDKIPKNWGRYGKPVITLEDQYGGQSVIGIDDHCFVLYNGSDEREFKSVAWWYKEAVKALQDFLNENPDWPSLLGNN